jgi:periplasmic protein TonB
MKRRLRFTLYHGFVASLALHSAIAAPFVLQSLAPEPEETSLVIELQGDVSDSQSEQQILAQTQGNAQQDQVAKVKPAHAAVTPHAQPPDKQPTDVAMNDTVTPPPPPETAPTPAPPAEPTPTPAVAPTPVPPVEKGSAAREMKAGNSANNNSGAEQQQNAQTIAAPPQPENDRLDAYVKQLARKIQSGLVYPADARRAGLHGTATVSFTILTNGQIRPNSLKIAKSSGEAKLDAGALETIRTTAPFAAPPEEIAVSIALVFGRRR